RTGRRSASQRKNSTQGKGESATASASPRSSRSAARSRAASVIASTPTGPRDGSPLKLRTRRASATRPLRDRRSIAVGRVEREPAAFGAERHVDDHVPAVELVDRRQIDVAGLPAQHEDTCSDDATLAQDGPDLDRPASRAVDLALRTQRPWPRETEAP